MKKVILMLLVFGLALAFSIAALAEEKVLYDFETGLEGWEIPDWAHEQDDYVADSVDASSDFASKGKNSLKVTANFPGKKWTGAIAEIQEYFDWTPYTTVSCDLLVPEDAEPGLKAKIILTVGDEWKWTEMSRSFKLKPGEWITISANLRPGSMDWKRTHPTDEFRQDIRKLDIRVESNMKPAYSGPIYIDNVRVE